MTYCERIDATFWAEPVNAVTNLAFVIAAVAIATTLFRDRQAARKVWDLWLLAGLVAGIGIGSFLWHTLATPWSGLADVIPILLFINVYLVSFMVRIATLRVWAVVAGFFAFQVLNAIVSQAFPPDTLNGSLFYVPTWATLWLMVAYCWRADATFPRHLLAAGLVFTLSLTMRTLDIDLCPTWPLGTHFAWHLLNGLVLYLVTLALINARHRDTA